jgi:hypothetical protein
MNNMTMNFSDHVTPPACPLCGDQTRLYGIEPHLAFPRTDIRTYVCKSCDGVEVMQVPLPAMYVDGGAEKQSPGARPGDRP